MNENTDNGALVAAPADVRGTAEDCGGSYVPVVEDQYRPDHSAASRWGMRKAMGSWDRHIGGALAIVAD